VTGNWYQIKYANVPCPTCGASVLQPCRAETGYNYNFKYTHAARIRVWFYSERRRGRQA